MSTDRNVNIYDWYWLADDGRLYGSAAGAFLPLDTPSYATWLADGGTPRRWPEEENGGQTDAALQTVLAPYGLFVTLDPLKAALKARVDGAAELERRKYITPGAGQAMTYQQKAAEAKAFTDAEDSDEADFPMLMAEVGITAPDIAGVAASVLGAEMAWRQIGAAIEGIRLSAKKAIDEAENADEANDAADVTWPAL